MVRMKIASYCCTLASRRALAAHLQHSVGAEANTGSKQWIIALVATKTHFFAALRSYVSLFSGCGQVLRAF